MSQINALFGTIQSQTAYGQVGSNGQVSGGGVLAGNLDLRQVTSSLVNTIFPPGGTSLAPMGLDVDKTGNLTFDKKVLRKEFADGAFEVRRLG